MRYLKYLVLKMARVSLLIQGICLNQHLFQKFVGTSEVNLRKSLSNFELISYCQWEMICHKYVRSGCPDDSDMITHFCKLLCPSQVWDSQLF